MSLYSTIRNAGPDPNSFLRKVVLFEGLDEDQLSRLAATMQRRQFAAGVTLFHQDMPGMMLYLIESGVVRIYSIGRTGQELTFELFGAGDVFGELSILDDKHHSASAITLTPTAVWMLPKSEVDSLLDTHIGTARALIRLLVLRIRSRAIYTEAMTFQDVQGRLAYVLSNLAERFGKEVSGGVEIDLPVTQFDLSTIIGVTRESVNKALATLRTAGLVELDGSRLVITNRQGMVNLLQNRGR